MRPPLAILYATVSGNAEQLAELAAARLEAAGRPSVVHNLAGFSAAALGEFRCVLIIASTWGAGEPPPDAAGFLAGLRDPGAARLDRLSYAVLALGSSMYPDFCACGREIDARLAALGARPLAPRVEADTKYLAAFEAWIAAVIAALPAGS